MKKTRFVRVDVFTKSRFGGNPLAVFPEAKGLTDRQMQQLAREMNLSETTFVLPPSRGSGADFRVRIFTPDLEVPYAGHPTLGTFFVLADEGRVRLKGRKTVAMMEVKAGVLPVEIYSKGGKVDRVVTVQNEPKFWPEHEDPALVAKALGLRLSDFDLDRMPPQMVSTGLPWLIAPVRTRKAVEDIRPDIQAFTETVKGFPKGVTDIYVTCFEPLHTSSTIHSRGFSLVLGAVVEDPATGSASGDVGAYLVSRGLVKGEGTVRIANEQGYEIGRPSSISIEVEKDLDGAPKTIRVGGSIVRMMDGFAYV